MSFPHTIFGKFGDEKETSTTKRRALGTVLELPDGRKFKYALNGGSAISGGHLVASKVMVANHDEGLATAATAAGSQTVTVTLGATDATAATNAVVNSSYNFMAYASSVTASDDVYIAWLADAEL